MLVCVNIFCGKVYKVKNKEKDEIDVSSPIVLHPGPTSYDLLKKKKPPNNNKGMCYQ